MHNDQRTIEYLESSSELADFCLKEGKPESIGFDTEFLRVKTYFPKACLFQVATSESLALIDVLKIDDLSPFLEWLANPDIMIIMHAAGQDLELLKNLCDELPTNMFDTQIANAFLAEDGQLGYAGLVEQLLDVSLEKSQSRTDWSRRPLSSAQKEYAVDDVRYLHQMQELLTTKLEARNVLDWFQQDCHAMENLSFTPSADDLLGRVKAKRGLTGAQLATVRSLAVWRESEAIKRDLPRKWMLADEVLVELAMSDENIDLEGLEKIESLTDKQRYRYGETLINSLEESRNLSPDDWPMASQSHTPEARNLLKKLQAEVKNVARNLELTPGLLASRKTLQALVNGEEGCALRSGWRFKEVGETLTGMLD